MAPASGTKDATHVSRATACPCCTCTSSTIKAVTRPATPHLLRSGAVQLLRISSCFASFLNEGSRNAVSSVILIITTTGQTRAPCSRPAIVASHTLRCRRRTLGRVGQFPKHLALVAQTFIFIY